jgi:hypothetical protein
MRWNILGLGRRVFFVFVDLYQECWHFAVTRFMNFEVAEYLNWCILLVTKVLYHSIFRARSTGFQGLFSAACGFMQVEKMNSPNPNALGPGCPQWSSLSE